VAHDEEEEVEWHASEETDSDADSDESDSDDESKPKKRAKKTRSSGGGKVVSSTRGKKNDPYTQTKLRTSHTSAIARESSFKSKSNAIDLVDDDEDDATGISAANIVSGSRRETRALSESAKIVAREQRRNALSASQQARKKKLSIDDETEEEDFEEESDEETEASSSEEGESGKGKSRAGRGQKIPKLQQLLNICERKFEKLAEILSTSGIEYEVCR
jgi:hypothetical protein